MSLYSNTRHWFLVVAHLCALGGLLLLLPSYCQRYVGRKFTGGIEPALYVVLC